MKTKASNKSAPKNSKPGQSLMQLWVPTQFHTAVNTYASAQEVSIKALIIRGLARETGIKA